MTSPSPIPPASGETRDEKRERGGRLVRETWVKFCRETQAEPKPSHVAPWEELSMWDKEVDRRIFDAVEAAARAAGREEGDAAHKRMNDLGVPNVEVGGRPLTLTERLAFVVSLEHANKIADQEGANARAEERRRLAWLPDMACITGECPHTKSCDCVASIGLVLREEFRGSPAPRGEAETPSKDGAVADWCDFSREHPAEGTRERAAPEPPARRETDALRLALLRVRDQIDHDDHDDHDEYGEGSESERDRCNLEAVLAASPAPEPAKETEPSAHPPCTSGLVRHLWTPDGAGPVCYVCGYRPPKPAPLAAPAPEPVTEERVREIAREEITPYYTRDVTKPQGEMMAKIARSMFAGDADRIMVSLTKGGPHIGLINAIRTLASDLAALRAEMVTEERVREIIRAHALGNPITHALAEDAKKLRERVGHLDAKLSAVNVRVGDLEKLNVAEIDGRVEKLERCRDEWCGETLRNAAEHYGLDARLRAIESAACRGRSQ